MMRMRYRYQLYILIKTKMLLVIKTFRNTFWINIFAENCWFHYLEFHIQKTNIIGKLVYFGGLQVWSTQHFLSEKMYMSVSGAESSFRFVFRRLMLIVKQNERICKERTREQKVSLKRPITIQFFSDR